MLCITSKKQIKPKSRK